MRNSGADPYSFPPFYGNRSDFSYIFLVKNKTFQVEIWKVVWTVSKYLVWMTQKFRKGDFGELKSKKRSPGEHAPAPPLEGCTSGARLGNRSFVPEYCLSSRPQMTPLRNPSKFCLLLEVIFSTKFRTSI